MGLGKRDNKGERPYYINYVKGSRKLADSAKSYDDALARIKARLAKPHNRGEVAEIWVNGGLIYSTAEG